MRKHWLILLFLMVPAVVLGVGSAKRIINLPGFTTDRVLIVNTSGEIDDTAVSETELNLLDGVTGTLVTEAGTATLTNKTIDADGTGNSITNIENADIKAGAAIDRSKIANGTADHVVINNGSGTLSSEATLSKSRGGAGADMSSVTFPTAGTIITESSTSTLTNKTIDFDSNTLTNVVSTDSVVDKNFWSDYQAVTTSNVAEDGDYTTYAGTPDNSAAQLSVSSETTDELSGTESYSLDKAAGADASGQAWILELDAPDRLCTTGGNAHYLTFKYETSANYDNSANERVEIFTYGNSSGLQACNARDTLSGTFSNNLPVAPNSGQYQCAYSCDSADTQIDVVIAYTGTATNAVDIVIDEIRAGPDAVVTAPIVTEWQSYTTTITNGGTTSTDLAEYMRDGPNLYVKIYTVFNGSGSAGTLSYSLPSGLTADTAAGDSVEGIGRWFNSGVDENVGFAAVSGNNLVIQIDDGGSFLNGTDIASGDRVSIDAKIKITEYANSNAILSTTQADHQTVTAKYKGDPASATANNPVIVPTLVEDDFSAYNTSTGLFTSPSGGRVHIFGVGVSACTGGIAINAYKNGSSADTPLGYLDSNGEVTFNGYVEDVGAGDTLSIRPSSTCDFQAVRLHFVHIPDFSTFSTYGPYEHYESESAGEIAWTPTAGSIGNLTSISVGPGTWKASATAYLRSAGATTTTTVGIGFSTAGTTTFNSTDGQYTTKRSLSNDYDTLTVSPEEFTCTSACTIYLNGIAITSIANLNITYSMDVWRVK